MSRKIIVLAQAEKDIVEAHGWYEEQRPGLGADFRSAIDALVHRVRENPLAYPVVHKDVRRAVLRRFPYLLYFIEAPDRVIVIACLHGRRSPSAHRSRL